MLSRRFRKALLYATRKHHGQVRKGTEIPYVAHVLQVAGLVLEYGGDEDQAIAALLHDVVEDCDVPLDTIERTFGFAVRAIVEGCSDSFGRTKAEWHVRKRGYIERLEREPPTVQLVSACDKLHNARSIVSDLRREGVGTFDRFKGRREGTLWYYRTLADVLRASELRSDLTAELERVVGEMEALSTDR